MKHLTIILVFLSFLFSQTKALGNEIDSTLFKLANQEFVLASQFMYTDFDSAILHLDKAMEISKQLKDEVKAIGCSTWKINTASYHFRMAELKRFLLEADQLFLAAESKLDSLGAKNEMNLSIQVHWGNYYYKLGDFDKANGYFDQMIDALKDKEILSFTDYEYLASNHNYKGTIHKKRGNYQPAIDNFLQVLHYSEECLRVHKQPTRTSIVIKHLAETYQLKGDYDNAEKYYVKGINQSKKRKQKSRNSLINYYNAFAKFYIEKTEFDSALFYLDESLKIHTEKDPFFLETYQLIGEVRRELNDQPNARSYFEKAHQAAIDLYGDNHYKVAAINLAHGKSYEKNQQWDIASTYYDKAIQNLLPNYLLNKKLVAPPIKQVYAPKELVEALSNKSNALFQLYKEKNSGKVLENSYQFALRTMDVIDSLRLDYDSEASRQFLVNKSYPIFEQAMAICYQLYKDQNEPKYLEEAFRIAEKSKAVLLLDALANAKAEQFSGIPDEVLENGRQIQFNIKQLENNLRRALLKKKSEEAVGVLRNELFEVKQNYQAYIKQLESEHPKYYQLKYDLSTITLSELKKELLNNNKTTLVEYFIGEENIYAFTVSKQRSNLIQIPAHFPLKDWVKQLRDGIAEKIPEQAAIDYTASAFQIYDKLLSPLTLQENLIIIPDGVLGYVPFDALLKRVVPNAEVRQYSTHPYLINDHNITYCFSATLLREMTNKTSAANKSFLGFAPSFSSYNSLDASREMTKQLVADYQGDFLGDTEATKSTFEKKAGQYNIVHISSHAIANDSLQDACYLVCAETNNRDDFLLYNRDLYQLDLNASLVVLGACETGSGQLQRGEGIISLARGFSYAGASSLLTTLWSVDEATTANLLQSFYKHLQAGTTTDAALLQAKRTYLANPPNEKKAHPRYWAALIPIGDMQAVNSASSWWPWSLGLFGGLLLVVGYLWSRKN